MANIKPTPRRWLVGVAGLAGLLFTVTAWRLRNVEELTATVIVVMAVASVVSLVRMRRSSFWVGFTTLGWGWLAIPLAASPGPALPETRWIDALRPPLAPSPNSHDWLESLEHRENDQRDRDAYRMAGHCLVSLLLGLAGGGTTRGILPVDDRQPSSWRSPDGSLFQSVVGDQADQGRKPI